MGAAANEIEIKFPMQMAYNFLAYTCTEFSSIFKLMEKLCQNLCTRELLLHSSESIKSVHKKSVRFMNTLLLKSVQRTLYSIIHKMYSIKSLESTSQVQGRNLEYLLILKSNSHSVSRLSNSFLNPLYCNLKLT